MSRLGEERQRERVYLYSHKCAVLGVAEGNNAGSEAVPTAVTAVLGAASGNVNVNNEVDLDWRRGWMEVYPCWAALPG